jgi:putative alpha-1,2-mannosidase
VNTDACVSISLPCLTSSLPNCTILLAASPGYFSIRLARYESTLVEATATRRTSLYRITYPDNTQPAVVMDVANDLYNSFQVGQVAVEGASRIIGSGTYRASFGPDDSYFTAYFCADFNATFTKFQTFNENGLSRSSHAVAEGKKQID